MHKKSVEAAASLETEDDKNSSEGDEQRSGSIAALRARAKEHNARIRTVLCGEDNSTEQQAVSDQYDNSFKNL